MEAARNRQLKRNRVQDLATLKNPDHVRVTQTEAEAKPPTETELEREAPALFPISQRENHDLGKFIIARGIRGKTQRLTTRLFTLHCSERSRSEEKNEKSRSRSVSPANHSPERNNESMDD